jgi:hypothetical protein
MIVAHTEFGLSRFLSTPRQISPMVLLQPYPHDCEAITLAMTISGSRFLYASSVSPLDQRLMRQTRAPFAFREEVHAYLFADRAARPPRTLCLCQPVISTSRSSEAPPSASSIAISCAFLLSRPSTYSLLASGRFSALTAAAGWRTLILYFGSRALNCLPDPAQGGLA